MNGGRHFQRKVDRYDGQVIWIDGESCYELGNYLGGGAAGVVYEAVDLRADPTNRNVAIKILNPVGFKLMPGGPLQRCLVAVKGTAIPPEIRGAPLREDNVWWLVHPNSKQVIAAYEDPKYGTLREVPLPKCIEIWGWDGMGGGNYDDSSAIDELLEKLSCLSQEVMVDGISVTFPRVPPKYVKWLRSRRSIYREISNMKKLGDHPNVIKLHEVLELIQDSKSTLFLVLELVTGGELFDRIKVGCGTTEDIARRYFRQLLSGVGCCHARGVCHRDLKPENLLLSDGSEGAVLKIADFGLSAAFAIAAGGGADMDEAKSPTHPSPMSSVMCPNVRRLRSVVGSPHYVAPEVTTESVQGYDGTKADAWSAGVILYAMLVGSLPFGKELSQCMRFQRFRRWISGAEKEAGSSEAPEYPPWLFPQNVSPAARSLIVGLLHPDPPARLSIDMAVRHAWLNGGEGSESPSSVHMGGMIKSLRNLDIVTPPPSKQAMMVGHRGSGGLDSLDSPQRTWN